MRINNKFEMLCNKWRIRNDKQQTATVKCESISKEDTMINNK